VRIVTRPILVPVGGSFSLCRRAELHWNEKINACKLVYYDGTGSQRVIEPLAPGRYKLLFWYAVSRDKSAKKETKTSDVVTWLGEVVTEAVVIEIMDGATRGFPPMPEQSLKPFNDVRRIRESRAVTQNDAKFVIAAQTDWKPRQVTRIEIQLCITNFSNREVLFPTFDTFFLRVLDKNGKMVRPRGGRRATAFTRPILLSGGVSYSLCRRADLLWDEKTKSAELDYYDGTGSEAYFGPLAPGRYKLAFSYAVFSSKEERNSGPAPTWFGRVITDDVLIEILNP